MIWYIFLFLPGDSYPDQKHVLITGRAQSRIETIPLTLVSRFDSSSIRIIKFRFVLIES